MDVFDIIFALSVIAIIISTITKRYYKREILKSYRLFKGESPDGLISGQINMYFLLPYESNDPDFYKNSRIKTLRTKFRQFRWIQLVSIGIIIISVLLLINYGIQ